MTNMHDGVVCVADACVHVCETPMALTVWNLALLVGMEMDARCLLA